VTKYHTIKGENGTLETMTYRELDAGV